MEQKSKIQNILKSIKFEVENIDVFEKDLDSVLGMFNEIKEVNVDGVSSTLNRKKITLLDLREDISKDWNFRPEMKGNYFKAPNVSKK
jgi:aspartyl/glutamyl-tRNA(Asn/Gln) amidotransferase C subunit